MQLVSIGDETSTNGFQSQLFFMSIAKYYIEDSAYRAEKIEKWKMGLFNNSIPSVPPPLYCIANIKG